MSWCFDAAYPPAILAAIAGLGQLTKLSLACSAPLPAEQAQLTALTALQDLTLMVERPGAAWAPPPPSAFPALRVFKYDCQEGFMQLAGAELRGCELRPRTRQLSECCGGHASGEADPGMLLLLHDLRRLPPLGPFLAALQPPGSGPIRRFKTQDLHADLVAAMEAAAAAAGAPPADGLRGMWLIWCHGLGEVGFAGLLRQAPQLQELLLRSPQMGELPGCITSMRGLTRLHLPDCKLADLPEGAWLADLLELDIFGNRFSCLPAALAAATGLTRLAAGANPLGPSRQKGDPLAVLQQLPRLRELCLARTQIGGLPKGGWIAGLQDLDLRHNDLPALPPALTAATSLTRLALTGNPLEDSLYCHTPLTRPCWRCCCSRRQR
ncbi:hypothetical protein ABPG75_008565 [Micractinium tetrahymenae]